MKCKYFQINKSQDNSPPKQNVHALVCSLYVTLHGDGALVSLKKLRLSKRDGSPALLRGLKLIKTVLLSMRQEAQWLRPRGDGGSCEPRQERRLQKMEKAKS